VEKGNAFIRNSIGEKLDNGFLGISQVLKVIMDDLINHLAQYFEKPKSLSTEIGELEDISEYNKYLIQKTE
jgi:hypothetical protein